MAAVHFNDGNFDQEVLKSSTPVVVDFFAEWCGPCKMMSPSIDKLAKEFDGKIKIGKLDIDANPVTGDKFQIQSIPTLIFFKNGETAGNLIGFKNEDDLRKAFQNLLS